MPKRMVDVGFKRLGRRVVDRTYRQRHGLVVTKRMAARAERYARAGKVDEAAVLYNEASARARAMMDIDGAKQIRVEIDEQRDSFLERICSNDQAILFMAHRLAVYTAVRSARVEGLSARMARLLHRDLRERTLRRWQAETLVGDLLFLSVFCGSNPADAILKEVWGVDRETYQSPIVDLDLAREVNTTLPITSENIVLLFYASGLWKEVYGFCYPQTCDLLLNWALRVANLHREAAVAMRVSFLPNMPASPFPRGLAFAENEITRGDRKLLVPRLDPFIAALEAIEQAINHEEREQRFVPYDDALLYARAEFIKPAIASLRAYCSEEGVTSA